MTDVKLLPHGVTPADVFLVTLATQQYVSAISRHRRS